jgi:hypothetical protein
MFHRFDHVWNDAVARNTEALRTVIGSLLGLLSLYGGTEALTLPRGIRATILQVLRPAEAALRRIILIAARDVTVEVTASKAKPPEHILKTRIAKTRSMSFQLFDPRKRSGQQRVTYTSKVPRIFFIAPDAPFSPLVAQPPEIRPTQNPEPEKQITARRMCLRLKALAAALEDVPRQAKRLVRLQARRDNRKSMIPPLRPGKPPGHRNMPTRGIDYILEECHKFAMGVLAEHRRPDTS